MSKLLPLPERITVTIERRAITLDADGNTEATFVVRVDDAEQFRGVVNLPPHRHDCPCDLPESLRKMVLDASLGRLLGLPVAIVEIGRAQKEVTTTGLFGATPHAARGEKPS